MNSSSDELILFAFRAGTAGWCGVEVGRFGDYDVPRCGQHFPSRPLPRRLGCSRIFFSSCFAWSIAWRMVWLSMTDFCKADCASF